MAYTTLRNGSRGNDVTKLQRALIDAGYDVGSSGADGIYGAKTKAAVTAYQKANGLSVDGIAGKQTLGSLYSNTTSTTSKNKNTNTNETTTIKGVTQDLQDKAYNNTFNESDYKDVMEQKDKLIASKDRLESLTSVTDIVDQATWDALNTGFVVSDAYNQAMAYTNQLLAQLSTGRTSYTDQIKDMMNKIQNREDFEYDVDQDQLFQQALASAMNSGRSAMQDTIGQASALTGGYGSTYATSAGNQAYNAFIEDAYNNLPEYYQMAMEAYQMEGQEMYNQLGMLQAADESEWNKMYSSWDANFKNAQTIWNQDFSTWEAGINQAYNSAQLQISEHGQLVDDAYKAYSANFDMYDSMYSKVWNNWDSQVKQAQAAVSAFNTDAWNQATYEQTETWNQKDLDYKYANLALDREKFNYSKGDTNNDGNVSEEEKAALYNGYINPDDVEVDENGNIVKIDGYNIAGTETKTPSVSGFRTTKGDNFEVAIGDKSYKVENEGKVSDKTKKNALASAPSYGNIVVDKDGAYLKQGEDYYKLGDLEGFLGIGTSTKSGYSDLLLALQKK